MTPRPPREPRPVDLRPPPELPPGGGLLLVDKPAGCTSHDVVGRLRHVLRTRKIGHAGTLDPMATGLLVLAVDRSTKLLGHLALTDKTYLATIRLGQQTDTDDADGTVTAAADSVTQIDDDAIRAGITALTGDLLQVPSSVSAIKVGGRRAYDLVRAGETVQLTARPVTVSRFEIIGSPRHQVGTIDVDVLVDCTTGTYVRSLARDLGAALGVGGHLTSLRRTRVGPFDITDAVDVFGQPDADSSAASGPPRAVVTEAFAANIAGAIIPAVTAVRVAFPIRIVDPAQALDLRHGRFINPAGIPGTYGVLGHDGALLALVQDRDDRAKSVLGWQINI
jgi:tRNA pseudouridine55 synthase